MTADEFRAWHDKMGYSYATGPAELGVSRATYARMLQSGGTHTIALACAALAAGLRPWRPDAE